MIFFETREDAVEYVVDFLQHSERTFVSITITKQEKSEDYYVTIATEG
jgi:hypothetical protein